MSVYIMGMEMPNKKNGAVLIIYPGGKCAFEDGKTYQAVPVPPHGDLIDRDKFRSTVFIGEQCLYSWDELEDAIDYAPTIIPAEPPKEETE